MKTAGGPCHMQVGTTGGRRPFIDSSSGGSPYANYVLAIGRGCELGEEGRGMNWRRGGNIEGLQYRCRRSLVRLLVISDDPQEDDKVP